MQQIWLILAFILPFSFFSSLFLVFPISSKHSLYSFFLFFIFIPSPFLLLFRPSSSFSCHISFCLFVPSSKSLCLVAVLARYFTFWYPAPHPYIEFINVIYRKVIHRWKLRNWHIRISKWKFCVNMSQPWVHQSSIIFWHICYTTKAWTNVAGTLTD